MVFVVESFQFFSVVHHPGLNRHLNFPQIYCHDKKSMCVYGSGGSILLIRVILHSF